jgi:hypothetical protein
MQLQLIREMIFELRGQSIMLDFDIAQLYEVETRSLNQAVKRNLQRFPNDFMFQLTKEEWIFVKSKYALSNSSHFVMSSKKHRSDSYLPYAFTEHGVAMLASVLRSQKAVEMNIVIVRAFIALKRLVIDYKELAEQIALIEHKFDGKFEEVYEALNLLICERSVRKNWEDRIPIGF